MRFDREPWVKLYRAESPAHRLMSLEARGFRDLLLRHADEKGVLLERSENPARDLCRVISADSSDAKKVGRWLKELADVGYLEIGTGGRVCIPKFEEAQTARSPGARRQAAYEERERAKRAAAAGSDVRTDTPLNVSPDVRTDVTREEMRERREEIPPSPPRGSDDGEVPRLIPCPADLALPPHVVEELAAFFGCTVDAVRAEQREFIGYWTIGGGMGRTFSRANWLRKCRERVRQRLGEGGASPSRSLGRDAPTIASATPEDDERRRERERARDAQKERELGLVPEGVAS